MNHQFKEPSKLLASNATSGDGIKVVKEEKQMRTSLLSDVSIVSIVETYHGEASSNEQYALEKQHTQPFETEAYQKR